MITKWVIPIALFPSHPDCNPIPRGLGRGGRAEHKSAGLSAWGREPVSGAAQGCDATGLHAGWRELAEHGRQLPVPLILLVTPRLPACPAPLQLHVPDCRAHPQWTYNLVPTLKKATTGGCKWYAIQPAPETYISAAYAPHETLKPESNREKFTESILCVSALSYSPLLFGRGEVFKRFATDSPCGFVSVETKQHLGGFARWVVH